MTDRSFVHKVLMISALFSLILLASCEKPSPANRAEQEAGRRGGSITYRLSAPPDTLNYLRAKDEPSIITSFFLMTARLIEFDHRQQAYAPGIAESWQVREDGMSVDVRLRPDAKFSDGRQITPEDVIFTISAIYDERTNSPVFKDVMLIEGRQISVSKTGDHEVRLVFPERVASVENYLDNLGVLPRHILEEELAAGTLGEAWKVNTDPAKIVTSGPFTVESSVPGERVTLRRNEHYYARDAAGTPMPYLDRLVLEVVQDPNNVFAALQQGTLDIADRIRPTDFAAFTSQPGAVMARDLGPGLGTDHIWFNLNPATSDGRQLAGSAKYKWFGNAAFRRAISMAVDRESIASVTMKGLATPLYGFVAPANKIWINTGLSTPYDLERARAALREAGFRQQGTAEAPELLDAEGNRVGFTMLVGEENEPRKLAAAVIQQDLAKLGIAMQIVPVQASEITRRWSQTFDYEAIFLGLAVTGIEPSTYANFIKSSAAAHQWHPNQKAPATDWEARLDELFARQAKEPNRELRAALFNEIQQIIADQAAIIPVTARHIAVAANSRVGNYSPSSIFPYSIWNIEELFVRE
jgi:peptide/nickel transport system substrate-binding protein